MAYFSLHAYDADVWVQEFRGLNQADVGLNPDIRYAAEVENVETPRGILQPHASSVLMDGEFDGRVETLAVFHRRWYTGNGSKNWYICAAGGNLYYRQAGDNKYWSPIGLPSGVEAFQSDVWSWCTYETAATDEDENDITVDIMLISNELDGMYMIVPPDRPTTWGDLKLKVWNTVNDGTWGDAKSPQWHIIPIDTNGKKFGVIARYAERIWGGAIPDDPDMLMYSRPYDPTDWTAAGPDEEPEDGAGDILQPSWDGDKFYALKAFGDQLLAFKKNHIWRVMGTNPGEYTFKEQYGDGTAYFNTISVDGERVFMLGDDGMIIYDGMSSAPYMREAVEKIWRTVNREALDQSCAVLFKKRYYLSFPVGTSTVNNAMLVYNLEEGTILYYTDSHVESFLPADDVLFATSSSLPGRILTLLYDSWESGMASGAATKWVSPWMDFAYKRIVKGGFDFYFWPEVKTDAVTLKISIQTEKKTKTKMYTVNPRTAEELAAGKEHKMKRLHFGGAGRKFRIIIESAEGITAPWRLVGGVQIVVETDPD